MNPQIQVPLESIGLERGQIVKTHLGGIFGQFKVVKAFKYEGDAQIYVHASTGVFGTHVKIENISKA